MIQRVVNYPPIPVQGEQQSKQTTRNAELDSKRQISFAEVLQGQMAPNELTFSAHALNRLEQRNIDLTSENKQKLETAVDKIAAKGGKESLIMMQNVAYLVNVQNRTVITAMDQTSTNDNVFTNIDSAMVIE